MIKTWKRLMKRLRRPSTQTIDAQARLVEAQQDDVRVNQVISQQQQIIRDNHLGNMIAALFEERSPRHK